MQPSTLALILLSIMAPQGAREYGGATLQQWQQRLSHIDPQEPSNAVLVPALIAIIQDEALPSDVRRPFAMTLGRMGETAADAVPALIEQIQRRDQLDKPTYVWAARALGLYGIHARAAVPALVDLLFDEDIPQGHRTLPMEALARIGPSHPEVMPALIRLLQYQGDDATKVTAAEASVFRELAAEAIAFVGPEADLAVPLLVRAVRNEQEAMAVRRKALVALGAIGPRAGLAVPAVVETMEFGDTDAMRMAASEALGKIGAPALPLLQRYLQHPAPDVRRHAAEGIAAMGQQAQPARTALIAALADADPQVRIAICESCHQIAVPPGAYVPPLIALLSTPSRQVRMRAMRLLIKAGPTARPYLPQLQLLLNHDDAAVRTIARKTLQQLQQ